MTATPAPKETLSPDATAALKRLQKRVAVAGYPRPWSFTPQRSTDGQLTGWHFADQTLMTEYIDASAQRFAPGKRPPTEAEERCFNTLNARVKDAGYTGTYTIEHALGSDGTLAGFSFRRDGYLTEYVAPRPRRPAK